MADVHTQEQRRFNMQQIKSKNTKPERNEYR
ncbi:MAG: very short patch repair endonuclease [Chitinophagaceae bacterium]|nr:very short patch repair endonuclease [Chitinophagaceae bacterium]